MFSFKNFPRCTQNLKWVHVEIEIHKLKKKKRKRVEIRQGMIKKYSKAINGF